MLLASTLIIGVLTSLIVKFFIGKWKLYQINVQSPNLYPFVIEFFYASMLMASSDFTQRLEFMNKYCWKYDGMVKFWLGPTLGILLTSPKYVHKVLNSPMCLEKWNLFYNTIDRRGGLIFGSVKNKWKEHRKVLNVVFGKSYLESYKSIYDSSANRLCSELEKKLENVDFDFFKCVRPICLNIVLESSTGRNIYDYPQLEELMDAVRM
jgi:cytochrome P450